MQRADDREHDEGLIDRETVYAVIDEERAYQDKKWPMHRHSVIEFAYYMEDYLAELKRLASRNDESVVHDRQLDIMRKLGAMAVACMEQNGVHERLMEERDKAFLAARGR